MAYPTVSAPYGLKPVNSVDGKPYAGATRQLLIAVDDYPTPGSAAEPLYYGDVVVFGAADTASGARVRRYPGSGTGFPIIGVFVGCTYINPVTKQPTWSQWWPGAAAAPNATAYIVDDPMALFQTRVIQDGPSYSLGAVSYAAIGTNMSIGLTFAGSNGNDNTGDSYMSALTPITSSAASPLRVVDVVPATMTSAGYVEVLVKLNPQAYDVLQGAYLPL